MNKPELINIDFNLPSNEKKLSEAESMINDIKKEIKTICGSGGISKISPNIHENLYDRTILILDWVGRMSMPIFAIRDELEEQYEKLYYKSPKLTQKMFDDHYKKLHQPYNILKNKCFAILDELDNEYEYKFKERPRNWNPK